MEMTRCLLHDKGLPKKFWAEVAHTSVFLLNRLPIKALQQKTPFEAWYDYKPRLQNLKTFGCLCFSYIPHVKRDKLDKKAEARIFIGYSSISKAYRIYLPKNNKVIVSRDVKFFELESWSWENDKKLESKENLEFQRVLKFQKENDNIDDEPVRGTKSLSNTYQRCNVAIIEPTEYEEDAADKKWMDTMKEELKMIEKKPNLGASGQTDTQKGNWSQVGL